VDVTSAVEGKPGLRLPGFFGKKLKLKKKKNL
jgi:hypothetical protein